MGLFQAFNISASGMTAERFRTDIIAQNIANVNTTSTKEGTPYRRKIVTFSEKNVTPFSQIYSSSKKAAVGNGVKVSSVTSDYSTDFIKEYDPSNPDADADGYVSYPNVNTVTEMTNLIDATRAYEANATAFEASKCADVCQNACFPSGSSHLKSLISASFTIGRVKSHSSPLTVAASTSFASR